MTKWHSGETHTQNYSSMGTALVMLAFMTTGEGWNQYMHDYAIDYPRCTNASASEPDSDCGNVEWAFTLFIAWNILSMYIFVNMFTGVVVENFSYVFQTSGGGAKSITREEMRSFKKIWGEFANVKTGLLERGSFVKFFGKLNGAFEVRIYPSEYNIRKIANTVRTGPDTVDAVKLDAILSTIDYAAIRRRRNVYARLLNEANLAAGRQSSKSGGTGGISFTGMLMLLAHHKLIVDREALNLKDLVARTEINRLVTDLVNLDRVKSMFTTISYRRRFLAHMKDKRMQESLAFGSQHGVPHIVVDSIPSTPSTTTRDIASAWDSNPPTPTPPSRTYKHSSHVSLALDMPSPGTGLSRSNHRKRISDVSMLSADITRSPRESFSDEDRDPQGMLSSMQDSMWGDLMNEAMEEVRRADG